MNCDPRFAAVCGDARLPPKTAAPTRTSARVLPVARTHNGMASI